MVAQVTCARSSRRAARAPRSCRARPRTWPFLTCGARLERDARDDTGRIGRECDALRRGDAADREKKSRAKFFARPAPGERGDQRPSAASFLDALAGVNGYRRSRSAPDPAPEHRRGDRSSAQRISRKSAPRVRLLAQRVEVNWLVRCRTPSRVTGKHARRVHLADELGEGMRARMSAVATRSSSVVALEHRAGPARSGHLRATSAALRLIGFFPGGGRPAAHLASPSRRADHAARARCSSLSASAESVWSLGVGRERRHLDLWCADRELAWAMRLRLRERRHVKSRICRFTSSRYTSLSAFAFLAPFVLCKMDRKRGAARRRWLALWPTNRPCNSPTRKPTPSSLLDAYVEPLCRMRRPTVLELPDACGRGRLDAEDGSPRASRGTSRCRRRAMPGATGADHDPWLALRST